MSNFKVGDVVRLKACYIADSPFIKNTICIVHAVANSGLSVKSTTGKFSTSSGLRWKLTACFELAIPQTPTELISNILMAMELTND